MQAELKSLKIDRNKTTRTEPSRWATRWIIIGIALFVVLGAAALINKYANAATEVETMRVHTSGDSASGGAGVVLNATGYIVAHHKIEVAAKVIGKVQWIGVEKGDHVRQGQVLVRLEDDEYRAQLQQTKGNLANLLARLAELQNGSRPEEIAVTQSNLDVAKADLVNAKVNLDRTKNLASQGVVAKQSLDDAQARYDGQIAKVASLAKTFDLARIGPRKEQIDAVKGQVEQARGSVAYAETTLENTIIRAPVTGTILERAVEKGEFVTTCFVGDRAKRFRQAARESKGHGHHRRLPGSQVRRAHFRDLARGQPPESHRPSESESGQSGRLSAARDEFQRVVPGGRPASGKRSYS